MSIPAKEELLSKKEQLENIKETLKQEFVGIDDKIDEIVDSISSWYLVPTMQKRPLVVNLWGMTGVGKTALVRRLVEMLGFSDWFYHFDIGESTSWELEAKHRFRNLRTKISGNPFVCCFDDFQFARTIAPNGTELDKPNVRFIWELMDSGILKVDNDRIQLAIIFEELIDQLKHTLQKGVVVENGKVIRNKDLYIEILSSSIRTRFGREIRQDETGDLHFIPTKTYKDIKNLANQSLMSTFELEKKFAELNGRESIQLLEEILDGAFNQEKVDCRQALIFVIGNLDEAFSMSGDINPDLSADQFHENSLKINVSNIKQTLKTYFRPEQVARLGSNHIIYPAFNENTYRKIIDLELRKMGGWLQKEIKVSISFHHSVKEFLYDEGVYPTLGTRPLLSAINSYITSKLGYIASELLTIEAPVDKIYVKHDEHLRFKFISSANEIIAEKQFSTAGALSELREPQQNNFQALNAVHESGHAVLSMALMHAVPTMVCSVSADASNHGFTHVDFKKDRISKREMIPRAAVGLGGYLAEKLVFGEENIHSGSDEDLRNVTKLVTGLVKTEGMGSDPVEVNVSDYRKNFTYHDIDGRFNDQVIAIVKKAEKLAEETLKANMDKLLILADYLSDKAKIDKPGIIRLLGIDRMTKNEQPFRKHLKERVKQITEKKTVALNE